MANVIKLKRGTSTPTTSDITNGEVALDTSAKKLFVNDGGTVKEIGGGGGVESDAQNITVAGTNAGDSFSGTDATGNSLFGKNAGTAISTGDNNVFLGLEAGQATTTGSSNIAIGKAALETNQTVGDNIAIGQFALKNLTSGTYNNAVGNSAGLFVSGATNNTFGSFSFGSATSATKNCVFGHFTGYNITSGAKNTLIGHQAGVSGTNNLTTGDNNIIIGHEAAASAADVDNEITLGDGNITKFRIPALSFSISASAVTNGAAFYENAKTVAADYTLSGSNAMAAGPITINSSVTVTISSGDTLTIV